MDINSLPKANEVYLTTPSGKRKKIGPPFPILSYGDTKEAGVYLIEQKVDNDTISSYFVSNIDTKRESDIDFVKENGNEQISNNIVKIKGSKDLKNIILWLALIFLCIEWVVYKREH